MNDTAVLKEPSQRLVSVDQLRGYAIFGMLLVNAKGLFFEPLRATSEGAGGYEWFDAFLYQISHHRTTFTYADTIAPLFVFVVGMGMRLSWLRRSQGVEPWQCRKHLIKRYSLLVLIAFAIYAGWLWDALMDIGLSGLLAVGFIDRRPRTRILAAFGFVILYQCIHMFTSYGVWSVTGKFSVDDPDYVPLLVRFVPLNDELFGTSLNGGPLGPLSWVMMLLFGSVAYDVLAQRNDKRFVFACLAWGLGLCVAGYLLHMEWPGWKTEWPFSARYMTAPFPLWSTGLCFFQLLLFHLICDKWRARIPTLTSVGMNPLAIYIAQCLILDVAEDFAPETLPLWAGLCGFILFWAAFAGVAHYMRANRIFIKL